MEDETVKIDCLIISCKYNLWISKDVRHCNLKHIQIGTRVITDYPHGIEGVCLNMEEGK